MIPPVPSFKFHSLQFHCLLLLLLLSSLLELEIRMFVRIDPAGRLRLRVRFAVCFLCFAHRDLPALLSEIDEWVYIW